MILKYSDFLEAMSGFLIRHSGSLSRHDRMRKVSENLKGPVAQADGLQMVPRPDPVSSRHPTNSFENVFVIK